MNSEANAIDAVIEELIDSCVMDDVLSFHRAIKLGYHHLLLADQEDVDCAETESGLAPHSKGESLNKSTACCFCDECHSKVAATRYASHLANCMGLGRNSSRRANKRIAEQQRFEDSDGGDETYYPDCSPASSSQKNDCNSVGSYSKSQSSSSYPSRLLKSGLRITGLGSKPSNGRSTSINPASTSGSMLEKTDSLDSISFSCDDDESNSSETNRRTGVSRVRRHHKLHT